MLWLDPSHLPETKGTVHRFLLSSRGNVEGLLLTDGTKVHFSPYLSRHVLALLNPGDAVTVRGVRPSGVDVAAAFSLETQDGTRIIDQGPSKKKTVTMTAAATSPDYSSGYDCKGPKH